MFNVNPISQPAASAVIREEDSPLGKLLVFDHADSLSAYKAYVVGFSDRIAYEGVMVEQDKEWDGSPAFDLELCQDTGKEILVPVMVERPWVRLRRNAA